MKNIRGWLVIRNGQDVRFVKTSPRLDPNEIAFEVHIAVPTRKQVVGKIDIELPEPLPVDAAHITLEQWVQQHEDAEA